MLWLQGTEIPAACKKVFWSRAEYPQVSREAIINRFVACSKSLTKSTMEEAFSYKPPSKSFAAAPGRSQNGFGG